MQKKWKPANMKTRLDRQKGDSKGILTTGFISSTVLDLRDLRNFLGYELTSHGFKMLLSEEGTIPLDSSKHSYDLCIAAARKCDFLIAIIDGRFGGEVPGTGTSITLAEIEASLEAGRQVRVFVRQAVWDAKEILRPYMKDGIAFRPSKPITDVRVFDVIDSIKKRLTGNWMDTFNTGEDILRSLSKQFGFPLHSQNATAVEKLDRILAKKALLAFNERLMRDYIEGVQVESLMISDAEEYEDACNVFRPHMMRFAGAETSVAFDEFMKLALRLDNEVPQVFSPSRTPGKYTSRRSLNIELRPEWQRQIRKMYLLARRTFQAWVRFVDLVRTKWPDVILELHERAEE